MSEPTENPAKIYLLPNLMTAGNLICGFLAILRILQGTLMRATGDDEWMDTFQTSLYFILAACVFDLLDGRLARLGGRESSFGREFDSLADIVSFGVAPALLVFKIVLYDFQGKIGWMIAVLYLVCGALRLARFNVLATVPSNNPTKDFTGFPIPAAAGLISSITLSMLYLYEHPRQGFELGYAKYFLAGLMIFLSLMMFSKFRYPSFKAVGWKTQHSIPKFLFVIGLLAMTFIFYQWMPAVIFITYLLYGFFRPFVSKAWRREIEEEEAEDDLAS
jgi:CDP-diacylglycerol--serine O-phosphatidyltransferase